MEPNKSNLKDQESDKIKKRLDEEYFPTMEDLSGIEDVIMNHDNLTAFLEDQMVPINTIIHDQSDDNSDEGPQIEYDSSAYKSIDSKESPSKSSCGEVKSKEKLKYLFNFLSPSKTIIEEGGSKETSIVVSSDMNGVSKDSQNSTPTLSFKCDNFAEIKKSPKVCPLEELLASLLYPQIRVFNPKMIYKNNKYCEWLNYNLVLTKLKSHKTFETGNRIKRRRRDSEFMSRQWSKNNGLSSMSLSKIILESNQFDKNNPGDCNFAYSQIFQTEERDKHNQEFDFDEEYDNVSIPFECSIPQQQMEDFLRDTMQKDINGSPKIDERAFDTFSPHQKDMGKQASSQKDINTECNICLQFADNKEIICAYEQAKSCYDTDPQVKKSLAIMLSCLSLININPWQKSLRPRMKNWNQDCTRIFLKKFRLQFKQQDHQEVAPMSPSLMKIRYEILSKVHDENSKSLKEENEGLKTLLLQYIPEYNYYKKISSWLISRKPLLKADDIRKLVDQHCMKFYNLTNKGLEKSVKLPTGFNSTNKDAKVENQEKNNKTPLRDISNLKKSDSFLTSNISYGNTPEKINVPNFPQVKDGLARRETREYKTPTAVSSMKTKRISKKRFRNQVNKAQYMNDNKENEPLQVRPQTSKEASRKLRHHFFDMPSSSLQNN
ncbi:unnamed protein product [Moneuplotes crassus]|uniref:Uncharacterized protein n=1 Tax=Euplotes crassus TaxID=5936 RepID=A0AAD1X1N0_EUPCR|nr:unnamed protein product [Moneuplotes crassus]